MAKSAREWFSNWNITSLKINASFLEVELDFRDEDKKAAWELYVELLTRIATQPLPNNHGDEKAALDSIYAIFPTTRDILKKYGSDCIQFSKIAIIVLNQIIRPFTAEWHGKSLKGDFNDPVQCLEFRKDLEKLQINLRNYMRLLSEIAQVEDLTDLED
ncbi:MAG: hypothetical protein SF053_08185 [Bacteroidia bacterium]|nr:hypothetical protein [Bacteroidia bacterium]